MGFAVQKTTKKIVFGCYEIPGYGGASTSGYKIFKDLDKDFCAYFYYLLVCGLRYPLFKL